MLNLVSNTVYHVHNRNICTYTKAALVFEHFGQALVAKIAPVGALLQRHLIRNSHKKCTNL